MLRRTGLLRKTVFIAPYSIMPAGAWESLRETVAPGGIALPDLGEPGVVFAVDGYGRSVFRQLLRPSGLRELRNRVVAAVYAADSAAQARSFIDPCPATSSAPVVHHLSRVATGRGWMDEFRRWSGIWTE
jgi:hypothetical protein